jgi:hypothetical protein
MPQKVHSSSFKLSKALLHELSFNGKNSFGLYSKIFAALSNMVTSMAEQLLTMHLVDKLL